MYVEKAVTSIPLKVQIINKKWKDLITLKFKISWWRNLAKKKKRKTGTHGHGQQCGDGLWGKDMGGGGRGIEGIKGVGKICFNFFCKNKQEHCK